MHETLPIWLGLSTYNIASNFIRLELVTKNHKYLMSQEHSKKHITTHRHLHILGRWWIKERETPPKETLGKLAPLNGILKGDKNHIETHLQS